MQIEETAGTPNKFIVLRQEVLYDDNLTIAEKFVYARMCQFDEYYESCEEAGQLLGISAESVKKAKQKIVRLGYAKELVNTGRGKRYKVLYDGQDLPDRRVDFTRQTGKIHPIRRVDFTRRVIDKEKNKEEREYACAKEAYGLSELLHQKIVANKPNRIISSNWRESWAKDIDRLHRIDKREWEQIRAVIEWSQGDSFWWKNILSGRTLREKFDRLEDDMSATKNNENQVVYLS